MTKNPHILIAGETGSGKSSEIRSILTTLIKNKSSKELRLILGDLNNKAKKLLEPYKLNNEVVQEFEDDPYNKI